jgi:hypothetical protein
MIASIPDLNPLLISSAVNNVIKMLGDKDNFGNKFNVKR